MNQIKKCSFNNVKLTFESNRLKVSHKNKEQRAKAYAIMTRERLIMHTILIYMNAKDINGQSHM